MPVATANPRLPLASRTAMVPVREAATHPFTDPQLVSRVNGKSRLSQMPGSMQMLLSHLDNQPRSQGVTVLGVVHACRVLGLSEDELVNALDDLNSAKAIFFVSFEVPVQVPGHGPGAFPFFACKPYAQVGDVPLKTAHKLALQLIREGRA